MGERKYQRIYGSLNLLVHKWAELYSPEGSGLSSEVHQRADGEVREFQEESSKFPFTLMESLLSRFLNWLAGDDVICETHLKTFRSHTEDEKALDYLRQLERALALSI